MADLRTLAGVSAKDQQFLDDAIALMGPEPSAMGCVKNLFWGHFRQDLLLPYPVQNPEEAARCETLLTALDDYLLHEHPATQIDQQQEIPHRVIERLFELGVLGMTIPREYGGGGF